MGFCEASAAPCFTMVDEPRGSLHVQLASPFFCFELPLVAASHTHLLPFLFPFSPPPAIGRTKGGVSHLLPWP